MNRRRIPGAIRFSAFMLAWTAAVVLMTLQLEAADVFGPPLAAGEPVAPADALVDLPAPPALADADAWDAALVQLARRSEVMNGSWQPAPARAVPRIDPVADVKAAAAEPAAPARAEAVAAVERSIEPAPGTKAEPSMSVARVVKEPAARPSRFGADKSRARGALRDGRFTEAYALLRPRVSEARHDSEYLGLLALAAMRLGSHGEAMVLYQRLAAIEPGSGRWRMGLALAQESLGLDASSEYQQALALAEDADGMRALLGARVDGGGVT